MNARLSTPLVVLALLALFSSPALAAPRVTSADIIDGAVMTVDLADRAVTAAKIQDGVVTNAKLATDVESRFADLENRVAQLEARLAAVAGNAALQLGSYVRVEPDALNGLPGPHVLFEGVNVHVRSGSGFTNEEAHIGAPVGRGNLIVGYNEFTGAYQRTGARTGSHNLIVGENHDFTSCSGFAVGADHAILALGAHQRLRWAG